MLLYDWASIEPDRPSTLERNAKWYIERNVGIYLIETERYDDAEGYSRDTSQSSRLLIWRVRTSIQQAVIGWLAFTTSSGIGRGRVETAKRTEREICSWHVLHAHVFLQEILVAGGDHKNAEYMIGEPMSILKEIA